MTSALEGGLGSVARERAIVLSFDNLGEASEMQRGTWPASAQRGRHPSVVRALPRLLDELDALSLRATFFVEGVNCELNPQAVGEIAARGHEVGVHGWCHEPWGELEAGRERELLERCVGAFGGLGVAVSAFRPPGGALTAVTVPLLRSLGFAWCSPLGSSFRVRDGLARVPFEWELVDAFWLMESFGELRAERGVDAVRPWALADRLVAALEGGGGMRTLITHPFLMVDDAWWAGARRVLAALAALRDQGRAWVTAGDELAAWLPR